MTLPFLSDIAAAISADTGFGPLTVTGDGNLPSWFDVTGLAVASIGAAGALLAGFAGQGPVTVDRRLASLWFGMTLRPDGWRMPPVWDPIAGDYRAKDGWIRLHTNAPHHRAAALSVLGQHDDRDALAPVVAAWDADALEFAVVNAGGCAAAMRGLDDWSSHPQGRTVAETPLIQWRDYGSADGPLPQPTPGRPLAGLKVLDLTRVLAGPVAGRFLAAYGADVLRIDPPDWDEPGVVPEVVLGKRCAGLDLTDREDRAVFEALLADADVLLHGYRLDALRNLGYGPDDVREYNPRLIDVSLNAYGGTGPWALRRGFDSLVQMSCGIADYGMRMTGADKPVPLPVQALDMATGYLMAAAVLRAVRQRADEGTVLSARLSLAGTAHLLCQSRRDGAGEALKEETEADIDPRIEPTAWGPARRVRFPLSIPGIDAAWDHPAGQLRSSPAIW